MLKQYGDAVLFSTSCWQIKLRDFLANLSNIEIRSGLVYNLVKPHINVDKTLNK